MTKPKPKHLTREVFTIYGYFEALAARILIDEGKAERIDAAEVPPSHRLNDVGRPAKFAVSMPKALVPRFDRLIAELRA